MSEDVHHDDVVKLDHPSYRQIPARRRHSLPQQRMQSRIGMNVQKVITNCCNRRSLSEIFRNSRAQLFLRQWQNRFSNSDVDVMVIMTVRVMPDPQIQLLATKLRISTLHTEQWIQNPSPARPHEVATDGGQRLRTASPG